MSATAETENKKLVAEGCEYLVESGDEAVRHGKFCEVHVVMTYQGGDAFELVTYTKDYRRPSKAKR